MSAVLEQPLFSVDWVDCDDPILERFEGKPCAATVCNLDIVCNGDVFISKGNAGQEGWVCAEHLAYWLAANFFEILEETEQEDGLEWSMRHSMPYAGNGYIWPDLVFVPLPGTEQIAIQRTSGETWQEVHQDFLRTEILSFLKKVHDRLQEKNIKHSDFLDAYAELLGEIR